MANALARKFRFQVSVDGTSWVTVNAINDLNPDENATNVAADVYETNGFNGFEKTMTAWSVVAKFFRPVVAGVYDAGQEVIRATRFQFGDNARLYVRWFDKGGSTEALSGRALVNWSPSKTGVADIEEITVTFQGDGILAPITNPYNVAVVPVVTQILNSGKGVGQAVNIYGANFTGTVATTGVKFGGTNATDFTVVNDGLITAVLPAGSAGVTTVLVTNATGPSVATNNYTRIV